MEETWLEVASLDDFAATDAIAVDVDSRQIAIYFVGGAVFATDNRCTHGDARLCDGFLEGHEIECPHHQGRFDIRTGAATGAPAKKALATYPARLEGARVLLRLWASPRESLGAQVLLSSRTPMKAPMHPVITSLLDTDLYKFTMWQAMLHRHPQTHAEYTFVCRNAPAYPLAELVHEVNRELDALCALSFRPSELAYLGSLRFLRSDFVDFLRIFHFQRDFIEAHAAADGHGLEIVASGPQVHVMAFEIFVLAIVNELYFRRFDAREAWAEGRRRLAAKVARLREFEREPKRATPFEFFDFGVRRRFSGEWHREVLSTLKREVPQFFKGASDVLFARDLGLVPIGTMAHEYLQTFQTLGVRLRDFQRAALEAWVQEYRGDLGTALTDVVGMDAFLADFDLYFAKLFDGLRHDSGDPFVWGEKALKHYDKLRIDAKTKRMVFSDGLDLEKSFALYRHFADRTMVGFGIGTNLTNDMGLRTLHIVMKLTHANHQPVAKLSDSPGKLLCDDETFLAYLRQVFNVPA